MVMHTYHIGLSLYLTFDFGLLYVHHRLLTSEKRLSLLLSDRFTNNTYMFNQFIQQYFIVSSFLLNFNLLWLIIISSLHLYNQKERAWLFSLHANLSSTNSLIKSAALGSCKLFLRKWLITHCTFDSSTKLPETAMESSKFSTRCGEPNGTNNNSPGSDQN